MLELRSEGQPQPVRHNLDFILDECAEQLLRAVGRFELDDRAVAYLVAGEAVTDPPGEILPRAYGQMVLEIGVKGVAVFFEGQRDVALRAVIVHLQPYVAALREVVGPTPQHVASPQGGVIAIQPRGVSSGSSVNVALKRVMLVHRRMRVDSKAALIHEPVVGAGRPAGQDGFVAFKMFDVDARKSISA